MAQWFWSDIKNLWVEIERNSQHRLVAEASALAHRHPEKVAQLLLDLSYPGNAVRVLSQEKPSTQEEHLRQQAHLLATRFAALVAEAQATDVVARSSLKEALSLVAGEEDIWRELGDVAAVAAAIGKRAAVRRLLGDRETALRLCEEQERLCREHTNGEGIAFAWQGQADILVDQGEPIRALELYRKAEEIHRASGEDTGLAHVLFMQARSILLWNPADRIEYRPELDVIDDQASGMLGSLWRLPPIAGKVGEGMRLVREAESLCRGLSNGRGVEVCLRLQEYVLTQRDELEDALEINAELEQIAHDQGSLVGLADVLRRRALILVGREDYETADRTFARAEKLIRNTGRPDTLATLLLERARNLQLLDRGDDAQRCIMEVQQLATEHGLHAALRFASHALSFGRGEAGDPDHEEHLRWCAASENVNAQVELGKLLIERDPPEAERWLQPAAEGGNRDAMVCLGALLIGCDQSRAERWFLRAAELGHPTAMLDLGQLYRDSDPEKALVWYRRAAELGNVEALLGAGELLASSDPQVGAEMIVRALLSGQLDDDMKACAYLMLMRHAGSEAEVCRRAEAGDAEAMQTLGYLLHERNPDEALLWYQRSADAGHAGGMIDLGVMIHETEPVRAAEWFAAGAAAGDERGRSYLIQMVPRLRRLAEARDPDAMFALACAYWSGMGSTRASKRWCRRAAEAGHVQAMRALANLIEERHPRKAAQWRARAADQPS